MNRNTQHFYVHDGLRGGDRVPRFDLPEGYHAVLWRPSGAELRPPGFERHPFLMWGTMARLGLFAREGYGVFVVRRGRELAHYSCLLPKYQRFPFMGPQDLQIASTHTAPSHRGRGLAKAAVSALIRSHPGVRFWYFASEDNIASLRVIRACGFEFAGAGYRSAPCGVKPLGRFVLDRPASQVDDERA